MTAGPTAAAPTADGPRRWARGWFAMIAVLGTAALLLQLVLLFVGGQDANSGDTTAQTGLITRLVRFFSYFTVESNVFAVAAAITLVLDPNRDGRVWRVIRLNGLYGILITGLVFHLILAPVVHLTGAAQIANIGLHYLVPWLSVIGWILFGPRPRIDWTTVGWGFVWPVAWVSWTFAHGALTGFYPYGFLDAEVLGYPTALANTSGVIVVGAVAILLAKLGDRLPVIRR